MTSLSELRRLREKATPGPWCWGAVGEKSNGYMLGSACDEKGVPISGRIDDDVNFIDPILIGEHEAATCNYHDPTLIVAMHAALPDLVAVAEAARRVNRVHKKVIAPTIIGFTENEAPIYAEPYDRTQCREDCPACALDLALSRVTP